MLGAKHCAVACAALGLWAWPAAADEPRAVSEPVRLTAGASNQWMGVLDPATGALYFVSDRNSTAEIFVQRPISAGPRLLFDSNADVSWPRPSPDGKLLAYISSRADATGDLCVMDIGDSEHSCPTSLRTAELQPLWTRGGDDLAVLLRTELHGNYELRRFAKRAATSGDDKSTGELILQRNMLGVAISPDGRWLAYVPLERTRRQVGVAFANRSGDGLMLQRLDGTPKPVRFAPDLPGLTGFPVFGPGGRHLYFAQYLNDTNGDGTINGDDNSVLFRVPFDSAAKDPVASAWPEQLSSAQWNCRYPAPAPDQLIATCSHQGSLDIYSLPLGGAVPEAWDAGRIRGEIHAARNHWTKLLLFARLASAAKNSDERIDVLRHMVRLHVELREYESVTYHCEQIRRIASPGHVATLWADVMLELAGHRQEDVKLTHGQLSDRYLTSERERITRLQQIVAGAGARHRDIAALAHLVISEVEDDIGKKDAGEAAFDRVDARTILDRLVLEVYAARARAIYGLRGDRKALLETYRELAGHSAFDTLDRLRFAEHFVRELLRGVAQKDRPSLVAAWVQKLQSDSELALMIQVSSWLLQLDTSDQNDVRKGLFALYKKNQDPDRRRALVLATVRTAARQGNEFLQYQFATSWASWLQRGEPERKYAEELYRKVVMERAYTQLAQNQVARARAAFYASTVQTLSLEAHIGFIEARIREGNLDVEHEYAKRFVNQPDSPVYAFVKAYLIARRQPSVATVARREEKEAIAYLERAARAWPRSMEVQHVWGTVLHQRALRRGSREDAIAAHSHYLLALDLARENVRHRAALLLQLGLLQASLGNHRIALRHFAERDRLPHVRPEGELSLRMAMARSSFHIARHADAVGHAERSLALLGSHPELARYRPLVLDRLALYQQSAGQHESAMNRYSELIAVVDAAKSDVGARINRVKARLGAAAAASSAGEFDRALTWIEQVDSLLAAGEALHRGKPQRRIRRSAETRFDRRDYQILLAGLRAHAHRGKGDLPGATRAMERRRELLASRFEKGDTDEDLLELARAHYHLGEYAFRAGQSEPARVHLEKGLELSADYNRRTGSGVNEVGLRLLQAYAELHLYGKVALRSYKRDLVRELGEAYKFICDNPSPNWAPDRFLFGFYLTMLEVSPSVSPSLSPSGGR